MESLDAGGSVAATVRDYFSAADGGLGICRIAAGYEDGVVAGECEHKAEWRRKIVSLDLHFECLGANFGIEDGRFDLWEGYQLTEGEVCIVSVGSYIILHHATHSGP
jgi:hypothetical protein